MDRGSTITDTLALLTSRQQVLAVVLFTLGFTSLAYMARALWYLSRSETELRSGLTPQDLEDPDNVRQAPADEIYLSDAGRLDRQRGWRCARRGIAAIIAMFAVYSLAQLAHLGLPE